MRLLSVNETAAELSVAVGTLRRWYRQGLMLPFGRTVGEHRRFQREALQTATPQRRLLRERRSAMGAFLARPGRTAQSAGRETRKVLRRRRHHGYRGRH